ncbi:MAG TPA: thioesterase family protein [Gemmatimonadales bacterium]
MSPEATADVIHRVTYSETDQMGVAYYGWYTVWLEKARTEYLRQTGMTYRELEAGGLRLAVSEVRIRYRAPARYDDLVRVRCWVREIASRRVTFGYAVELAETGTLLATAETALLALDQNFNPVRLPNGLRERLPPSPDPVRI